MKPVALALAASFALISPAAFAAEPVTLTRSTVNDGYAKLHRYCDQQSRCWTEGRRNALLQTYETIGAPPWFRKPVVASQRSHTKLAASKQLRNAQARMR